jgi:hypothetical protein
MRTNRTAADREPPPDAEQARADLEQFRHDAEHYASVREDLQREYPEHWVAIYQGKLAAADPDEDRFFASLERQGVPASKAVIEHLLAVDVIVVL